MDRMTVRTPASSANLGPGYDAFGLALGIYNEFSAVLAAEWSVEIRGGEANHLRSDAKNPVARAMARAFAQAGRPELAAHLVCDNGIPTGRGLGSSAAAIVGGLLLGSRLAGVEMDRTALLELATQIEGHPDNVAAVLLGGFTISALEDGAVVARSVPIGGGLAAVLAISRLPFKTKRARKLLPERVLHADAAFNAGRAGMLAAAFATGDRELMASGMRDRIHEQYRGAEIPGFDAVVRALQEAGAVGAVLSGAGPTVIGLVPGVDDAAALDQARVVAGRAAPAVAQAGAYRTPIAVEIDRAGACVSD